MTVSYPGQVFQLVSSHLGHSWEQSKTVEKKMFVGGVFFNVYRLLKLLTLLKLLKSLKSFSCDQTEGENIT